MNKKVEDILKFILNECIPPVIRDRRLFMFIPFKLAFKVKANVFLDFKRIERVRSNREIDSIYQSVESYQIQQQGTDISNTILKMVLSDVAGQTVIDVGCGKGILASHLVKNNKVFACDIILSKTNSGQFQQITFIQGRCENLPFKDHAFDTVICTHTLEHVQDIFLAINELRRIANKKLIIILPKERPYLYSFNLHLHFFPYKFSVLQVFCNHSRIKNYVLKEIDNCWYYQESYFE